VPLVEGRVLAFEWLGRGNHLDEHHPKRGPGRYGTSADAFCVLTNADGRRIAVVIEWKYTERYDRDGDKEKLNPHYDRFFADGTGPLRLAELGLEPQSVRYEPFYQLARLAALAHRIEVATEDDVDEAHLAWIVPEGNVDLRNGVTSPTLEERFKGQSVESVFRTLLRKPDRFHVVAPATLLRAFPDSQFPEEGPTVCEVRARYAEGR
jgi:hypothetical protein